ncbi:hypothetical protein N657DRAFT_626716 [Parathielavia appendiculata]|uniref:Heterokaryon incompatibility domain-containing protein n=1 Tax=Parathielavia appendiculata TaxID=2587402 RepID=A0AAN6YZI9_9PEZI|nr:hypothetical protein N657DRAFT_626716 [Parathielavia appendiculata]
MRRTPYSPITRFMLLISPATESKDMRLSVLSPDFPDGAPTQLFGDRAWGIAELDLQTSDDTVDFICLSYSWGLGRTPSPFHPTAMVSDRTEPAVSAIIMQRPACQRIWVDAFSVPGEEHPAERAATLESMGFIYSQAIEVIVVLTEQACPAIEQIRQRRDLLPTHLGLLEKEDWVTRAWTYQEAVNAKRLFITCENAAHGTIVDCTEFLSYLGHALILLPLPERAGYPRLDSFEDVMTDWNVAGYLERSALQVMSAMDTRSQTRIEDHFYAMIGALSNEPAKPVQLLSPCEAFISLCERKGDYSFIFSSVERDTTLGRRWRPVDDPKLPAIIRLPSWGNGFRGRVDDGCLILENVVILKPAPPLPHLDAFMKEFVAGYRPDGAYAGLDFGEAAFKVLQELGFRGTSEYVSTGYGFFFCREQLPQLDSVEILVAAGIRWCLGAPGIARYTQDSDKDEVSFYEPGVFVGSMVDLEDAPTIVRLV